MSGRLIELGAWDYLYESALDRVLILGGEDDRLCIRYVRNMIDFLGLVLL